MLDLQIMGRIMITRYFLSTICALMGDFGTREVFNCSCNYAFYPNEGTLGKINTNDPLPHMDKIYLIYLTRF